MTYTHLGDAHLVYVPGMGPVVDLSVAPGQLLGNGTGRIEDLHSNGELRWSSSRRTAPGISACSAGTGSFRVPHLPTRNH